MGLEHMRATNCRLDMGFTVERDENGKPIRIRRVPLPCVVQTSVFTNGEPLKALNVTSLNITCEAKCPFKKK